MTYHYQIGATRWKRHDGKCDVRLATPPKGWARYAYQLDNHPHHQQALQNRAAVVVPGRVRREPTVSLYTDLIAAGVPIGNWQSDLYAPVNDTVKEILKRHPGQAKTVFKNQIDGKLWYEFPFQYDPFWSRIGPLPEAAP